MATQPKNVVVKIKGGMGNQMFQYTFGRALGVAAKKAGTDIQISFDTTAYTNPPATDTRRPYYLSSFAVNAPIATAAKVAKARNPLGIFSRGLRFLEQKLGNGNTAAYIPSLLTPPFRGYYEGYWQSEKYFVDFADEIRREFTFTSPLGPAAQKVREQIIADPNAVSIFYRRTDYVGDKTFDIGEQAYQKRALARMKELVPAMKLYVMSDDITWVRENANLPEGSVFVSSPKVRGQSENEVPITPQDEMQLLSACKHHIIPNSTFAWWGAWLNPNSDKIVIAPKVWANNVGDEYKDITPPDWLRV